MLVTPGNQYTNFDSRFNGGTANQHSSIVDENYVMIGGHIDMTLREKIKRGEFVDFAKLLPKDQLSSDESKLELIQRGGQTFFVPTEREGSSITSFYKWEQAFRVFSDIYLHEHPDRATTSMSYTWDNIYYYNREFCLHLGAFPERSWGIILQQAWSMCLKDRINFGGSNYHRLGGGPNHGKGKKEICQRFNKGLCTAGRNCKYDHKCLECGKFGHGAHICRRRNQNVNQSSAPANQSGAGSTSTSTSTANK